jgi:hypothetical protein
MEIFKKYLETSRVPFSRLTLSMTLFIFFKSLGETSRLTSAVIAAAVVVAERGPRDLDLARFLDAAFLGA